MAHSARNAPEHQQTATPQTATRQALSVFGPTSRQEPLEWTGEAPLAPELARFYREVGPEWIEIDTAGLPFQFFALEQLWGEQAGYRWNRRTGAQLADWNEEWTVVAKQGSDPFILDGLTGRILTAPGDDGWEDRLADPEPTFESLEEMALALAATGTAWARWDDPFDERWSLRRETTDSVVEALESVLGSHPRAAAVARKFGYYAAV
ncbi:hypothetical protein [Microbacterium sp. A93]|uniref:hypothetical protein n=1 Tax=Microbacterium sp. A93 TaxID=3450716 RepID=UPI003F42E0D7